MGSKSVTSDQSCRGVLFRELEGHFKRHMTVQAHATLMKLYQQLIEGHTVDNMECKCK